MKILLTVVITVFTISLCNGQTNKSFSGDTAFLYKALYKDVDRLGVKYLISNTDKFHFRFWKNNQIIDIWSSDGITYYGTAISYIKSYDSKRDSKKEPKLFFKKDYIDTLTAKKSINLVQGISAIPTDKLIKGWVQGLDGIEYIMETSTPYVYSIRNYWTPTAQDSSLLQAKQIQTFIQRLDTLLQLKNKFKAFFNDLKPGAYSDGSRVWIKLTNKQREYFNRAKPYRDYLNSINDTLNHYLSDTLTRIFQKYGELKCYDEFSLIFSKDNKLMKVTTNSKLNDKEDRQEFRVCKKKIEAAFRLISIDFVHSKVNYLRELSFTEGKATVRSNNW